MTDWRPSLLGVIRIARALALAIVLAGPAFGQSPPESLSASFRKAVDRAGAAVVTVRPIGIAAQFPLVPRPAIGAPLLRDLLPRRAFGAGEPAEPAGSGLVIDAERGYVLTNEHVLAGSSQAAVILADGRERRTSQIRRDARTDLALLAIDPTGLNLKTASWGDSSLLDAGDWAVSIGRPAASAPAISAGIVSARRIGIGIAPADEWIETDAVVNFASSGGPLVNLKGEVVGLCTLLAAGRGGLDGMRYAIPASRARRIAGDLAEFGRVRRAFLGVQIAPVEPSGPEGVAGEASVVISSVSPGTPAAEAGLRPGDRLLRVDGKAIMTTVGLQSLVEFAPIGEEMKLIIERAGKRLEVKVRPQAQPAPGGRVGPGMGAPFEAQPWRGPVPGGIRAPGRNLPRREAPGAGNPPGEEEPSALDPIPAPSRAPEGRSQLPRGSPDDGGRL
jgi:serine protease Do